MGKSLPAELWKPTRYRSMECRLFHSGYCRTNGLLMLGVWGDPHTFHRSLNLMTGNHELQVLHQHSSSLANLWCPWPVANGAAWCLALASNHTWSQIGQRCLDRTSRTELIEKELRTRKTKNKGTQERVFRSLMIVRRDTRIRCLMVSHLGFQLAKLQQQWQNSLEILADPWLAGMPVKETQASLSNGISLSRF